MLKEKVPPSSTAMPARIFYKRRAYCTYNPLYWIILLIEIQYFTYTPYFDSLLLIVIRYFSKTTLVYLRITPRFGIRRANTPAVAAAAASRSNPPHALKA